MLLNVFYLMFFVAFTILSDKTGKYKNNIITLWFIAITVWLLRGQSLCGTITIYTDTVFYLQWDYDVFRIHHLVNGN